MSTHEIMREAFLRGIVPTHLHGQTQHKTLGARLSVDILNYRKKSLFFRTQPGRFFLREFMKDKKIPIEFRTPIVARRRKRELKNKNIACISTDLVATKNIFGAYPVLKPEDLEEIISSGEILYCDLDQVSERAVAPIYSYVILTKKDKVLVHTKSKYAESRASFAEQLSLGFAIPLAHDDMTLFDFSDHGMVAAGLTAVAMDLDIEFAEEFPEFEAVANFTCCPIVQSPSMQMNLLGIVKVEVPEYFNPIHKKLAIRHLQWIDIPNKRRDYIKFDPWAQYILKELQSSLV